jgi:hypothetical protein
MKWEKARVRVRAKVRATNLQRQWLLTNKKRSFLGFGSPVPTHSRNKSLMRYNLLSAAQLLHPHPLPPAPL